MQPNVSIHSILIIEYDPAWPAQFRSIADQVAAALGDIVFNIEHVGSTSVAGLAAKPIIDIDVTLTSFALLPMAIDRLGDVGYKHQGDLGIPGRHAFAAPMDSTPQHLYLCDRDAPAYREHILFRDHLRCHAETSEAYANLKRRLAASCNGDRDAYVAGKSDFIRRVLSLATQKGGHPPPA